VKSLADILWTVVRWTLPLTVAGIVAAGAVGSSHVGEVIRRRLETRLQAEYPALVVRVRSAAVVQGEGIVARGVTVVDPAAAADCRTILAIDEIMLACSATLAELGTGEPRITAVRVRRPQLHAARAGDGRWNIAALARPRPGGPSVSVAIEDGTIVIEDRRLAARTTMRSIAVDLRPAADGAGMSVAGQCSGDTFDRAGFEGRLAPATGGFEIVATVHAIDVSKRSTAWLPLDADQRRWADAMQGRVALDCRASGLLSALDAATVAVSGRLDGGRFEHPAVGLTVSDASAAFTADRSGVSCQWLKAHSGSTLLTGSGQWSGWRRDADFDLALEAEKLVVGRQFESLLPEPVAQQWSRLLPAGEVDVTARMARRSGVLQPDVSVRCRNVSLTHYRFPYRVDRTVGALTFREGRLDMHLAGQAGGQPVQVDGRLAFGGAGAQGFVEVRGDKIQIDDTLLAAMPARSADIVRALRAAGTVGFVFRHERGPHLPAGHANSLGIRFDRCTLCYAGFPYPLSQVSGVIRMDRGRWTIHDMVGTNDTGEVRCSGELEPLGSDDGELTLRLEGRGVVLEPELRRALPLGVQRIWDDVDPRGNAEFSATVRHRIRGRRTSVELSATPVGDTVSIEPSWFPYRLERLRGRIAWKDGQLRFEGVRGVHDRTTVATEGLCEFQPDGGWRVSFSRLTADRVRADHEVLEALPAGLRRAISGIQLGGLLSLAGSLDIYSTQPVEVLQPDGRRVAVPGPAAAAWDMAVDVQEAALDVGTPLEHVHGGVRLRGQSDGRGWWTVGDLAIDSATWRGMQLTGVRGPLLMDQDGVRFGSAAAREPGSARRLVARLGGGTLQLDGSVALSERNDFTITASLGEADLERLVADVSGRPNRYRGRVFGTLELAGSRGGMHSLAGRGQVRLRDADIYELSVVMSLLKILRVKAPDRNAFSSSAVDFRIEGPRAYLDSIELSGDAISLVGAGEVDFDSNVNLTFRSIVGDAETQLQAVKRLLGGASGQFLLVHVDGTLAEPQATTEAFPTLAGAVQRLQARQGGGRLAVGRREPPR
jgi:hypothetical protein